MVNCCIVTGCTNRQGKEYKLSFSRLPKDPKRRRLWSATINRKDYNPPLEGDVRVCGIHFINGMDVLSDLETIHYSFTIMNDRR